MPLKLIDYQPSFSTKPDKGPWKEKTKTKNFSGKKGKKKYNSDGLSYVIMNRKENTKKREKKEL